LTVVSGTDAGGNATVPAAECREEPPGDCECDRPTIFTVEYNNDQNSNPVTVEIYKKDRDVGKADKVLLTIEDIGLGDNITINSLDFTNPKDRLESNTIYRIIDQVTDEEIAVVAIHTSCSKPLFVGDIHDGDNGVSLTVVSGTDAGGNATVPAAECRV